MYILQIIFSIRNWLTKELIGKMSILFTSIKINGLTIPNRFFRSATFEALSNSQGDCTKEIIDLYKQYKSVGLIMSSCTQVDDRAKHHPTMLSLSPNTSILSPNNYNNNHLQTFSNLADEIHKMGLCFGVQLTHSGLASKKYLINNQDPEGPDTMSTSDIDRVIDSFANSAYLAYKYGADAVQIHCAGNYLLGTFLSSVSNHRTDAFGGNINNRCEIMKRTIQKVRAKVPPSFPLLIKINGQSETAFISPEEQQAIAKVAENAGIDAVEVAVSMPKKQSRKGDFSAFSSFGVRTVKTVLTAKYDYTAVALVKNAVSVPVISTGGHLEVKKMENFVSGGLCDMIGLSRPLIKTPNLVELFEFNETNKSTCVNCNGCLAHTSFREKPLECVNN